MKIKILKIFFGFRLTSQLIGLHNLQAFDIYKAENDTLPFAKKSKRQISTNDRIRENTKLLADGKISVETFMSRAIYWTIPSNQKKLALDRTQFSQLTTEVQQFESAQQDNNL